MADMNRYVSILLVLLCVIVQGMTALHAADYGVAEHEHHGKICEFYLESEKAQSSDVSAPAIVVLAAPFYFVDISARASFATQGRYPDASPRAPPYFS